MTVDEIMASGRYTDRRGRRFGQTRTETGFCEEWIQLWPKSKSGYRHPFTEESDVRLLIERDMHRDVCPGLWECEDHPVPYATRSRWNQERWYFDPGGFAVSSHSEAMDAAYRLAVSSE